MLSPTSGPLYALSLGLKKLSALGFLTKTVLLHTSYPFLCFWSLAPWLETDLKADPWPKHPTYWKLVSLDAFPAILSYLSLLVSVLRRTHCGYYLIVYLAFDFGFYFLFLHLHGNPEKTDPLTGTFSSVSMYLESKWAPAAGISPSHRGSKWIMP